MKYLQKYQMFHNKFILKLLLIFLLLILTSPIIKVNSINYSKLFKIDLKCEKDNNGRIIEIFDNRSEKIYKFNLDKDGYVQNIDVNNYKTDLKDKENLLIITSKNIIDSGILNEYINYKSNFYKINFENIENIEKNYSGFDLPEKIRNYLKIKYQELNLKYVLLIGNPYNKSNQTKYSTGGTVPMRYCYPDPNNHNRSNITSEDGSVPTDYYYADLTGDWDSDKDKYFGEYGEDNVDFNNELIVGRIPFDDLNIIKEILDRSINFEKKNSYEDKKKFLFAGGIFTYGNDNCARVDSATLYENIIHDILNKQKF